MGEPRPWQLDRGLVPQRALMEETERDDCGRTLGAVKRICAKQSSMRYIHVLYTQPDRASCDVSSSPSAPLAKTTSYAPSRAAREPSRLRQQTLRRDESQVNESGQKTDSDDEETDDGTLTDEATQALVEATLKAERANETRLQISSAVAEAANEGAWC